MAESDNSIISLVFYLLKLYDEKIHTAIARKRVKGDVFSGPPCMYFKGN